MGRERVPERFWWRISGCMSKEEDHPRLDGPEKKVIKTLLSS